MHCSITPLLNSLKLNGVTGTPFGVLIHLLHNVIVECVNHKIVFNDIHTQKKLAVTVKSHLTEYCLST